MYTQAFLEFTVFGQPIPKARPRVAKGRAYTPTTTKNWEELVAQYANLAMLHEGWHLVTNPVEVYMEFYRQDQKKADLDNLIKGVLDACNGVVYADDKQVRTLIGKVVYGAGKLAGVKVMFFEPGCLSDPLSQLMDVLK